MAEERPKKKRKAGWFVEVDPELKAQFKAYFPGRSAMTKVTVAAIKRAIRYAEENNLPRRSDA